MDLQPLFDFLGAYWWLAFPLFGAMAAIGGSMEQAAKRRHKRKLETLRLKSELRAAEIAARAQAQGQPRSILPRRQPRPQSAPAAPAPPALPPKALLERLFAEHDEITARWLDYELDVAKLIAFPAMSDGRQPLTAAFLRAKKLADTLRPPSADAKVSEQAVAEYLDAVGNYAVAFEVAERDARRLRDSTFTEAERKRLDRAQQLLKVAVDESATQAERNVAYKRVREELDGLIALSDEAVVILEKQVAREIGPGTRSSTSDQGSELAARTPQSQPQPQRMPLPKHDT